MRGFYEIAAHDPERPALLGEESTTYGELLAHVNRQLPDHEVTGCHPVQQCSGCGSRRYVGGEGQGGELAA